MVSMNKHRIYPSLLSVINVMINQYIPHHRQVPCQAQRALALSEARSSLEAKEAAEASGGSGASGGAVGSLQSVQGRTPPGGTHPEFSCARCDLPGDPIQSHWTLCSLRRWWQQRRRKSL